MIKRYFILASLLMLSLNLHAETSKATLEITARVLAVTSLDFQFEPIETDPEGGRLFFTIKIKKSNVKSLPLILASLSENSQDKYILNGKPLSKEAPVVVNLNERNELQVIRSEEINSDEEGRVVLETLY